MKKLAYCLVVVGILGCSLPLVGCGAEEEVAVEVSDEPVEMSLPGDMVLVPGGEFTLGSDVNPGNPPFSAPAHGVDVPEFEIDVYEVTNGEFATFQLESDYVAVGKWRDSYALGREDYPVVNVTWEDASAYCEWLGERLPTEAEWEKAARGSEGLRYPWGEAFFPNNANVYEYGLSNILEVGQIETDKSPYGVYDMMGNVQEWVADDFEPYPDADPEVRRHKAVGGGYKVVRGGGYAIKGAGTALWTRMGYLPTAQFGQGFRCARGTGQPAEETETPEN